MKMKIVGKKKIPFKKIAVFLAFEIIFTALTFPLQVFYGPFIKVRNTIVGTAMATFSHQYIAKVFLSDEKINEILASEAKEIRTEAVEQNIDEVVIEHGGERTIERREIKGRKFKGYALIISDPKKVKVGYTSKMGVEGQTTSAMAKRYKALAAINGGGFVDISPDGKIGSGIGAIPQGIVIKDGELIFPKEGLDPDSKQPCIMGITEEGKLLVGGPYSLNDLKKLKVKEALSFSPTLVVNGKPYINEFSLQGTNPRTAIGQKANGDIIFLVVDGRQGFQLGATLKDLQEIFLELEAVNAMCLDGGSSTTMYYDGEVINSPCNMLGERAIPTIVYVEP